MKFNVFRANYTTVFNIIYQVFFEDKFSNKLIEKEFKFNKQLGSRDRKFIAENTYEIVRWWKKLIYTCDIDESKMNDKTLDMLISSWLCINGYTMPDFLELNEDRIKKNVKRWNEDKDIPFAYKHSLCKLSAQKISDEFGEKSDEIALELNQKAPIFLRVNLKNIDKQSLIEKLEQEKIIAEIDPDVESCLKLSERANVFRSESFKKGYFEVQDKGSQTIAPFLQAEPKMKVVDACGGAGGKSLHLADIMQNKGRIISLDIHNWKLTEQKRRVRRNKVDIIETRLIENSKVIKRLHGKMDRVLLDVPCSGFGVIKRNPDTKWKFTEEKYQELLALQKDILHRYSKMVNEGGKLVYSTCSIFTEENEKQVTDFLKENTDWQLEEQRLILPTEFNSDGFYMARLSRV